MSFRRYKAQILDGRKICQQIISELREEINAWQQNGRKRPHLSVILVGNDAGSQSYVAMKMRAAKKAGTIYIIGIFIFIYHNIRLIFRNFK